eukprot:455751_1
MGDVGSAIATPFTATASFVSGTHNEKVYYNCPKCDEQRWVYRSAIAFMGRPCNFCRPNNNTFKSIAVACSDESMETKKKYYTECNFKISERGISSSDYNEKIIRIRVRSIWLAMGGAAASVLSVPSSVTLNSCTHWWVEIETENGWYCAMWDDPDLVLSSHSSRDAVTRSGKSAIGCENEKKTLQINMFVVLKIVYELYVS